LSEPQSPSQKKKKTNINKNEKNAKLTAPLLPPNLAAVPEHRAHSNCERRHHLHRVPSELPATCTIPKRWTPPPCFATHQNKAGRSLILPHPRHQVCGLGLQAHPNWLQASREQMTQ